MKLGILVLFILGSILQCDSQSIVPRSNSTITVQDARFSAQYNLFVPRYQDTLSVNIGIDSCGALIFTYDVNGYWYRACSPKRWVAVGSSFRNVANGITLSGDTAILGDSLNRFTYIQVLSHQQNGTRFNNLRLGNLPESQSIGGIVPTYPYTLTYNPSTLSIDRLYSEANHDTAYLQYGGGISGVTRFNYDSVGIYGATLPQPKDIVMPSQGVEYLYQINPPRDSTRWGIGRDGQQASVFVGQHDFGQTWGYNINVYSPTGIPGMPISTYKANLDFQRNIDNTRRYKMTGNGVAQYLSAYKTYQSPINTLTYEAGDYVSRVVGFDAFGTMYADLSTATKAKTLLVSTVDSSIGFRAHPQYRYTNDIKNGYGFWAEGDSDYNHFQGYATFGGPFPTRQNGGQDFIHRVTSVGDLWATDTTHGFIVDGNGYSVRLPYSVGTEAGIAFWIQDTAQQQADISMLQAASFNGRLLRFRVGNTVPAATYPNSGDGFRLEFQTGANSVNITKVWRNGNWTIGTGATVTAMRGYRKLAVDGTVYFNDTLVLGNAPLQVVDTTNWKVVVKNITTNALMTMPWAGGGGSSGLTVGTTAIASGTTTRVLFDNAGVLGEYTISGTGDVAMTTSPTFTTPILGTPTSGTLTNTTGYLWNNLANPTGTQTLSWDDAELNAWTNGSNTETFTTIDNPNLTTGIGILSTANALTTGSIFEATTTSTAKANGNGLFKATSSGANGSASITNVGFLSTVSNTGTTSVNTGFRSNVTGASTNWAFYADAGNYRSTGASGFYSQNTAGTAGISMTYDNSSLGTLSTIGGVRLDLDAASSSILMRRQTNIGLGIDFGNNPSFQVYKSASGTSNIQNWLTSGGTVLASVNQSGRFFIGGTTSATAWLHLAAGTATASTAPLKLTTGTSLTVAEDGALEYTTPQLFFTNGGAIRQELFQGQQSRVSTQFDKTNTTLANITGLTANVAAGKVYRFEATLYTTSDVAGGVKVAIGGTATATAIIYEGLSTDAGLTTQSRTTTLGNEVGAVTAVTAAYIKVTGTITVNAAGTLTCQFAENAATATSSVLVGSTFTVIEMP